MQNDKKVINTTVLAATFILAVHFLRELHLGQVNYLLLFSYVLALHFLNNNKWKISSILLGLTIFIKPFALIFLPYLLVKKKYKQLVVFISAICVFILLPFLFYGSIEMTIHQYSMWFQELQIELSHKQGLLADANHTIFSVLARYTPIQFLLINSSISVAYQICVLALIAFLVFYFIKIIPSDLSIMQQKYFLVMDFALLIALIPLLAFTSENAFIYTQLLIFVVLLNFQKLKLYEKVLSIAGFLFIGGNFSELIGKKLSNLADAISLISVGTVILLYILFVLRKRTIVDMHPKELV
jgi:hypothetical protein